MHKQTELALKTAQSALINWTTMHPEDMDDLDTRALHWIKQALQVTPLDLDYILLLVQCGEISTGKAKELIEGHDSEIPKFEAYFQQDEVPLETVVKARNLLTMTLEYIPKEYRIMVEMFLTDPTKIKVGR